MRTVLAVVAVLLAVIGVSALVRVSEHKVGGGVKFAVNKDHTLNPVMGVDLDVEQEAGPVADGTMACDVMDRVHIVVDDSEQKKAHETVLHCDGGRVYAIRKLWFR